MKKLENYKITIISRGKLIKMSISHIVNQFIESMIDEIDKQQYIEVFQEAYNAFDNTDYAEFVSIMQEIGIDCKTYQLEVMKLEMEWAINEWLTNTTSQIIFIKHFNHQYLNNNCGLRWIEFIKFLNDNHNQFDGVEICYNGMYSEHEIRRK